MKARANNRVRTVALLTCLLVSATTLGCTDSTVAVDVHGVNYGGNEFFYSIIDPVTQRPGGVGEHLAPYSGGGITCCFTLPKKWRPGIKVQLFTRHWLPQAADGSLPRIDKNETVEVPPYVDDKPGELWIIRSAEGGISVVSSNYEPSHPKWPGKVRGWPVPSIEYKREQWQMYRDHEEGVVRVFQSLLRELSEAPETRAKKAWEHAREYDKESIQGFKGPSDPRYLEFLRMDYQKGLNESKERLQRLMESRP